MDEMPEYLWIDEFYDTHCQDETHFTVAKNFTKYRRADLAATDAGKVDGHYCRNEHASGLTIGKVEDCKWCEKERKARTADAIKAAIRGRA